MLDLILDATAISLGRVTPIMFRYEFFLRATFGDERSPACRQAQRVPALLRPPSVLNCYLRILHLNFVLHGERRITFVIEASCYGGNGPAGNDFPNENHPSSDFAFVLPPNIEAQVDLVEVAVEWEGNAHHLRSQEMKSNQADEGPPIPAIKFRAGRNKIVEQVWVYLVVQHGEVAPLCSEERPR